MKMFADGESVREIVLFRDITIEYTLVKVQEIYFLMLILDCLLKEEAFKCIRFFISLQSNLNKIEIYILSVEGDISVG